MGIVSRTLKWGTGAYMVASAFALPGGYKSTNYCSIPHSFPRILNLAFGTAGTAAGTIAATTQRIPNSTIQTIGNFSGILSVPAGILGALAGIGTEILNGVSDDGLCKSPVIKKMQGEMTLPGAQPAKAQQPSRPPASHTGPTKLTGTFLKPITVAANNIA